MDELTLGDKTYVSSKRAAEITGYAKDYIGQLCREGHVEAKMVGRSWYVLESSIKAHRFGTPVSEKPVIEAEKAVIEEELNLLDTWTAPRYVAEEPRSLPPVIERPVVAPRIDVEEATAAISDMQAAWKEWFERKQEVALPAPEEEILLETPEIVDARYEATYADPVEAVEEAPEDAEDGSVAIPLNKIREAAPETVFEPEHEAVNVPIRTIRTMPSMRRREESASLAERPRASQGIRSRRQGSNVILAAGFVAIALIAIAAGVIGSGYADAYITKNPVLQFLGGTSTVNK